MNVIGIDPGNLIMAAVLVAEDGRIEFRIIEGVRNQRPSKKNPNPQISSPYFRARSIAQGAIDLWPEIKLPIYAIESASFYSKSGRFAQDTLAGIRQALFDCLAEKIGIGFAESYFIPVAPLSGKKALTGYNQSDKRRMVQSARNFIAQSGSINAGLPKAFQAQSEKKQEAIADALGLALAVLHFPTLINRRQEGRARRIPLPNISEGE